MIVYGDYDYVFDSVEFGIDVRKWREEQGLTQLQVAKQVGFESGQVISRIECGTYDNELKVKTFVAFCSLMNLKPSHYWDVQAV